MSLVGVGAMATHAAVGGAMTADNLRDGSYGWAAATSLVTAFSIAAAVVYASDVIEMEDQFSPYEAFIEQGEFNQERPQSLYDSIGSEVQKAYEAGGGQKKLTCSFGLK